ncbi:MAG TPA: hypothetical protein VIJ75_07910 [Hanamia sp.]
MSLDNIRLSKKERQLFFAKNLIETTQSNHLNEISKEIEIKNLGENLQQILFLVTNSENQFLPDEEMNLLSNLILACKLSMADIALVNTYNTSFNYTELDHHFHPKKILMFGIPTSELGLPFTIPFFQIQQFREQLYVTSPPLKDYLNNKNLKKDLWECLQKLFLFK